VPVPVPVRLVAALAALATVLSGCSSAGADDAAAAPAPEPDAVTTTTVGEPLIELDPCGLLDGEALAGPLGLGDGWVRVPQSAEECHWYQPSSRLTLVVLLRPAADRDLDALRAVADDAFSVEELDVVPGAVAVRDAASGALLEAWIPVPGGALGVFQTLAALDDTQLLAAVATVADRLPPGTAGGAPD